MTKPPKKASELCWIHYWDHEESVGHVDDPAGPLADVWNVGWIKEEDEQRLVLLHSISSTKEEGRMKISKVDIIARIPAIKPRAKKERL